MVDTLLWLFTSLFFFVFGGKTISSPKRKESDMFWLAAVFVPKNLPPEILKAWDTLKIDWFYSFFFSSSESVPTYGSFCISSSSMTTSSSSATFFTIVDLLWSSACFYYFYSSICFLYFSWCSFSNLSISSCCSIILSACILICLMLSAYSWSAKILAFLITYN